MIEPEQLATAFEPNLGKTVIVGKRGWDDFAGKADKLRTVPWYKVMAPSEQNTPVYYQSSSVAGLGGMISTPAQPAELPADGEVGAPLVKTATGVEFSRLRLLD